MEKNYKLTLAYDGTRFFGWEHQPDKETIQGKLETVLERLQGRPVDLIGAGRTGRALASLLDKQDVEVKVVEKDHERCQLMAEKLEHGIAICGDGTDIDLLLEEGVAEADVVVCLTEDDKLNLMLANGNKPLMSQRESIERYGQSDDVDKTLEEIKADETQDVFNLTE